MSTATPPGNEGGAPILLVESGAHQRKGHHPVMFAELYDALTEQGCSVVVLTSQGWLFADEERARHMDIRALGAPSAWAYRAGKRLETRGAPRFLATLGAMTGDAVMLRSARALRRRLGARGVVVTSFAVDPFLVAIGAGSGSWLVYQFVRPALASRATNRAARKLLQGVARRAQARRARRGGRLRVALNNPTERERWQQTAPWFEPVTLPFIVARPGLPPRDERSVADARGRLGLELHARYALIFGGAHSAKDWDVVYRAFARLDDPHLVIAGGGAADHYRAWAAAHGDAGSPPVLLDGFVTSETRDLLHTAVDVAVLSFTDGNEWDSGSLVNAVAAGVPIVCSRRSFAGDRVEALGLGALFEPGDAESLVAALRDVARSLDPAAIERARAEFSPARMAALVLGALAGDADGHAAVSPAG